jgi:putative ABC transport system ATP-binding protein
MQPRNRDASADGEIDIRPDTLHDADTLVARHEGKCWFHRPVTAGSMNIGVTKTAGLEANDNPSGAGDWGRTNFENKRIPKLLNDSDAHTNYLQGSRQIRSDSPLSVLTDLVRYNDGPKSVSPRDVRPVESICARRNYRVASLAEKPLIPTRSGRSTLSRIQRRDDDRTMADLLVATQVRKVYRTAAGEVEALRSLDLTVGDGEFVAVMGPSGSGKTTLLNCLSGLDDIDGGSVLLDGKSLHEMSDAERTRDRAASMGFVFQAFNLIPVLSAAENVELPLLLAGTHASEARRRAVETLQRVGLGHRVNHRPPELSGGEQQRVTIARALAGHPRLVWADEPTGALDSESAGEVMKLLAELHADGMTLILVTHDEEVGALAQRLVRMRDGTIVSDERQTVQKALVGSR